MYVCIYIYIYIYIIWSSCTRLASANLLGRPRAAFRRGSLITDEACSTGSALTTSTAGASLQKAVANELARLGGTLLAIC